MPISYRGAIPGYATNDTRLRHNELAFVQIQGDVYIFCAKDQNHNTCPQSFHL